MISLRRTSISFVFVLLALLILAPLTIHASATYTDGEYILPFEVLQGDADEKSATEDYMVLPAKAIVKDGHFFAEITLKNASWWQYFRVATQTGTFADVVTISEDKNNDQRVIQFEVFDTTKMVDAQIHIIVSGIPGFTYDNQYDIRFHFDYNSMTLVKEYPKAEQPKEEPSSSSEVKSEEVKQTPEVAPEKNTNSNSENPTATEVTPEENDSSAEENVEASVTPEEETTEPDPQAETSVDAAANEEDTSSVDQSEPTSTAEQTDESKSNSSVVIIVVVVIIVALVVIYFILRARKQK